MKVTCIAKYQDRVIGTAINVGDELEVTEERADVLINAGVATPTKVATKPKSKKKSEE